MAAPAMWPALIERVVKLNVDGGTDATACEDVAVNTAVTSAMVTRCRGPTKEGLGVDRPNHGR
jgi:hypothetical protein